MDWRFENARQAFERHRDAWDTLNRRHGNHVLLDGAFVGSLIRHFASASTLLGVSADVESPGMVLVDRGPRGFWRTFQPSQAPLGLILLAGDGDVARRVHTLLRSLPGYGLGLSVLQQDPDCTALSELPRAGTVETLDYIQTARLTLTGTFETYWKGRGKNLTHNLGRQRRRLADGGIRLELRVDRDAAHVAECIRDYGGLEAKGWKGQEGTAVTADNAQGAFYGEVLKAFCERREGVVYRLCLDGRVVASDLCLERGGTLVILKTAYDESVEGLSLGLLLHQEIVQTLFAEERIRVVEFYGRVRDWHTKWTDEIRTMYHVNVYRHGWIRQGREFVVTLSRRLGRG